MKYVLIWMVSIGIATGLADDSDFTGYNDNFVLFVLFAPAFAADSLMEQLQK